MVVPRYKGKDSPTPFMLHISNCCHKALNNIFEERRKLCSKLEKAISKLLRKATETWRIRERVHKKETKLRKNQLKKMKDVEKDNNLLPHELERPPASLELLDELVPRGERPRHRVGLLGLIGQKVDTVDWCKVCWVLVCALVGY